MVKNYKTFTFEIRLDNLFITSSRSVARKLFINTKEKT